MALMWKEGHLVAAWVCLWAAAYGSPEMRRLEVQLSPVAHQVGPEVLRTEGQLLTRCGLLWGLHGDPGGPKGGVLASPWRPAWPSLNL